MISEGTPSSPFKSLFSPIRVGSIALPNRIIMGSMHTGLEEHERGFKALAHYYQARAAGGAGLIITGGISPNWRGWLKPFGAKLSSRSEVKRHRLITEAVHDEGGRIVMQILHGGRYSYHPFCVAPSAIRSPISKFKPAALSEKGIKGTIRDFAICAQRAQEAGYDGVEIMGSEGYLINQFTVAATNKRTDDWGGSIENRIRLPLEITKAIKESTGPEFMLIYRISLLDLIPGGNSWDDVIFQARAIAAAGADIFNSGIGWHEARVPTIAGVVPQGGFAEVSGRLKQQVNIPVIAVNRINTPEVAEEIIASGKADMVSLARPFLADPDFPQKAKSGKSHLINTCIGCNQACLDHIFEQKTATCLVNPGACREDEFRVYPAKKRKRILVIGAGPAGMACAVTAAVRNHHVTVYERNAEPGGQFRLAAQVPGKEDYAETIRYYREMMKENGVVLKTGTQIDLALIRDGNWEHIVIATGVRPRIPSLTGIQHPKVISYDALLSGEKIAGRCVAILGAGGIGVDVGVFLTTRPADYYSQWGIDLSYINGAGLMTIEHGIRDREVHIFYRSNTKFGQSLGKTTGWIHRMHLKNQGVLIHSGVEYDRIDDEGLHYREKGTSAVLKADSIILCTGQVSEPGPLEYVKQSRIPYTVIGGARLAGELDAKRAIEEGVRCALGL